MLVCWPQFAGPWVRESDMRERKWRVLCERNLSPGTPAQGTELLLDPLLPLCRGPLAGGNFEVTPYIHENIAVKLSVSPEQKVGKMSMPHPSLKSYSQDGKARAETFYKF